MKWQLITSESATTRASYATVVGEGTAGDITVGGNTGGTSSDTTSASKTLAKSGSATYYVVVWLEETGEEQSSDASQDFSGSVTFTSVDELDNEGVTATFNIPDPVSFATDSWATIKKAVKTGNTSAYSVGDTKEITLTGFTNGETDSGGKYTLRIVNKSTPSECETSEFSQTACGFVVEFYDIITKHVMNDTATNVGGWPASSMRTYVNDTIYGSLPNELQSAIINTTVVSGHGSDDSSNFTSTDKLYLLSAHEVYIDGSSSTISIHDTAYNNTRQLDYYYGQGVTTSNYAGAIHSYDGYKTYLWLRNPGFQYNNDFLIVSHLGIWTSNDANNTYGVLPAFRIG